jgi:hypothetical protein
MSEFSWSFHIRAADAAAVEKLLGTAKFSGLVFGPANGWLTFVPYADVHGTEATTEPRKFSAKLLQATGLPVLAYSYVEDEYWSFALVRTGKPPCWFSCAWVAEPMVERDGLDLSAFDGICTVASIEPFLREPSEEEIGGDLAYGFAEALGLPAFRWLSPDYAQRSADYLILEGGRRVGPHQPVRENPLGLPPPRKFVLPNSDLSAREALALLRPLMQWMDAAWMLNAISGDIEWRFRYVHRNTRDIVDVCIHPNGTGDCRSRGKDTTPNTRDEAHAFIEAHRGSTVMSSVVEELETKLQTSAGIRDVELPANWLDSVQAVDIAARLQPPPDVPQWGTAGLSLRWDWLPEARWCVERVPVDSSSEIEKWTIDIDAVTGRVLTETLYDFQMRDGLYEPRRERIAGGAWRVL